jgi:formiminoglutamase
LGQFKWALIGLSGDEGVNIVGGRTGASVGPAAFMQSFNKLSGKDKVHETCAENIQFNAEPGELEKTLSAAAEIISKAQEKSDLTVVIGGGHEFSYSHLFSIQKSFPGKTIGCINIDPHLDLRTTSEGISSGSGFRFAIDQDVIQPQYLIEFGTQPFCNSIDLWDYAREKKVKVFPFSEMRFGRSSQYFQETISFLAENCDVIAISLDMDAIDSAFAPGVSAPAAEGFTPFDIMEMLSIAAKEPKVLSLGLFEMNPQYDIDNRTARIAAAAVYNFVAGKISTSANN